MLRDDVMIVSRVGSSRQVSNLISIRVISQKGSSLGDRRCGAGHGVSDDKVSVLKLKESMKTRNCRAMAYVYLRMYLVWF